MRIRYQQLLGLFQCRHCLLVGYRREIVQELSERMPAFEVVDQVLQGNPSSHEDRRSAQDVWIRVDDVVVSHAAGILLPLALGDVRGLGAQLCIRPRQ